MTESWTAYEFGADWWVASADDDSGPLLRVGGFNSLREQRANMIAASPDLYEAAKLALEPAVADELDDWYLALKNAVAEAEGR